MKEVALATPNETADTGIVQIIPETAPDDPATADLVRELRSHHDEWLDQFGIDLYGHRLQPPSGSTSPTSSATRCCRSASS